MLLDPRHEHPSLAGFIAWLEEQDGKRRYTWENAEDCACARYAKATGTFAEWWRTWDEQDATMWGLLNAISEHARSYGALLKHAKRVRHYWQEPAA